MVRSLAVTSASFRTALTLVAVGIWLGQPLVVAQAQGVDVARLIDAVLTRAAGLEPGTYAVTPDAIVEPERTARQMLAQADVLRGPGETTRVAVAVGTEVPEAFAARVRVVAASAPPGNQPAVAVTATAQGSGGVVRFVREFTLDAGEYEVHAAVGTLRGATGAVISLSTFRLVVPDVWQGALSVGPVALGEAVSAAQRGSTRSFDFGPTALSPARSDRFRQEESMHVAFRIHNWAADADRRPDLTVEYIFRQRGSRGFTFFNKMKPQRLTADTLGPAFDAAAGVVTAGASVPLVSFPLGGFELVVRVVDNRSKQTAERRVPFSVVQS